MNRKKAVTTVARSTNKQELAGLLDHPNKHVRHSARFKIARLFGLQEIAAQLDECVRRVKEYSGEVAAHKKWREAGGQGAPPAVQAKPSDAFWTINALKRAGLLDEEYEVAT